MNPYVFAWKVEVNNRKAAEAKAEKLEQYIEALEDKAVKLEQYSIALEKKNAALQEKQTALADRIKVQDEGREIMKDRIETQEKMNDQKRGGLDKAMERIQSYAKRIEELEAYIEGLKQERAEISIEADKAISHRDKLEWQVVNQAVKIEELRKRISDMEQTEKVKEEGRREMRERIVELSEQNKQLRRNCDSAAKEIFRLNGLLRKYAWCFDEEDKV